MEADRLELLLEVVDRSGRVVVPDEHDDAFDEYVTLAHRTGRLPGSESVAGDKSDAGLIDAQLLGEISLAVVGHVALTAVAVLEAAALRRGASGVLDAIRRRRARKAEPVEDAADAPPELEQEIMEVIEVPPGIPVEQIRELVELQIRVLTELADERAD